MADYVQLRSGVVVPEAVFSDAVSVRPELREIATTRDGRDITRGFVDGLPLIQPQDSILLGRGNGNYEVYEELKRDDQVGATMAQRQLAVASREWEVIPGGTMRRDKQAAESIKAMLEDLGGALVEVAGTPLSGWDSVTAKMLWGRFYGYSVAECLWSRDGREVVLDAVKVRNRRRFAFAPDFSLRLLTSSHPMGEELPDRKFWSFNVGADNDDEPYGLGLAHWLYWPVLFKRNGIKFWLIFLEKFGQPVAAGKFPTNAAPAERAKLLAAVQAIQTDSGIILPEGMEIELIEAARSGTADYKAVVTHMDHMIAKIVLGQVMTSEAVGGQYKADVQMDVRQDLVKADADLVCGSFNQSVARWLTDWNYPGAAYPKVWRRIEDEPDLKAQADRDKVIFDMGFRPSIEYIREEYGEGWSEAPKPEPPKVAEPPGTQAAFAQGDAAGPDAAPDGIDLLVEEALSDWQPLLNPMLEPIRKAMEQAAANGDTAQQLLDRLPALLAQMDADPLADRLTQASFIARLAGSVDAAGD